MELSRRLERGDGDGAHTILGFRSTSEPNALCIRLLLKDVVALHKLRDDFLRAPDAERRVALAEGVVGELLGSEALEAIEGQLNS